MNEDLKKELQEAAAKNNGKISCKKAWELADKYNFPKREMGKTLNDLNIKIINCQLGCF